MLVGHDVPAEDLAQGILWWTMSNNHVKITGMATLQLAPILEVPSTLDGLLHLNQMEPHDAWILDELEVSGSVDDVANSIRTGTARAVSDVSFKDAAGAAAFLIVSP
jgi:hypothetical protein